MTKFLFAILLISASSFAAFFSDEVFIHNEFNDCNKSMDKFTVVLETALRTPIFQMKASPSFKGACRVGFTYQADEKIQIDKGNWPSGLAGDICETFRKIAERRYLDTTTIPLLSSACNGGIYYYSYVNHKHYVPQAREEVFLVNPNDRYIDARKAEHLLVAAGAEKIEFFEWENFYGFAYRLNNSLKRIQREWDKVMPSTDNGYVYGRDEKKAFDACQIEERLASRLTSEMTEIGSHYECFVGHAPNFHIGMTPFQLKGGRLPKDNQLKPGWWQDWVPLAGNSQELIKCQSDRDFAMQNYEKFTNKKPRFALCVEKDKKLSYWMLGK